MKLYIKSIWILFGLLWIGCKKEPSTSIKPTYNTIIQGVYSTATIRPQNRYQVYAPVPGIIKYVGIKEGQLVKEGERLFIIEDNIIDFTTLNAQLQVKNYEQELYGANNLLTEIQLSLESATLKLETDSIKYQQQMNLWTQNIGSEQSLLDRRLAYEVSLKEVIKLQNQLKRTKENLQIQLASAKNNVKQSQNRKQEYTIKSNLNGKVYNIYIEPGEAVISQSPLAIIGDADEFIVQLTVDELDIVHIRVGQQVAIILDAFKDSVFVAEVTTIAPAMDNRSQTFDVEAKFVKAPPIMYDGLNGEANIKISEQVNTLTIPKEYLYDGNTVYTANGPTKVKTGITTLDIVEIISGIDTNTVIHQMKN